MSIAATISADIRITREEWNALQPGDVLRFHRRDGTYTLRTVITAPTWRAGGIHLAIMRRSWTGRCHTVRFWNDVKGKVSLDPRKTDRLMTDPELMRLCEAGFDIPRALRREREKFGSFQNIPVAKLAGAAMLARHYCKP